VRFHRTTHLVMGFECAADAWRMLADLKERLAKFSLTLHEDKLCHARNCRILQVARCRRMPPRDPIFRTS
jgi:RNA-directed DNA polymerase